MALIRKKILVAFDIAFENTRCDPSSGDHPGKTDLCDIATYLDGLVRKNQDDTTDPKFSYNLADPEVFPVGTCTEELLDQLRSRPDGEAQGEAEEGDEEGEGPDGRGVREGDRRTFF